MRFSLHLFHGLLWLLLPCVFAPASAQQASMAGISADAIGRPIDYLNYGIGDSSNMRGLEGVDERGDARWFSNLEYVFSYRKKPAIAHTLFVDIGNVYDNLNDVDFTDLRYTMGTGFRWKIESFVKTDLFLNYGYSPEEREGKLYGGTSLNF
ncbi:MAG: hypothetical protein GY815_03910 [Gammaproteobacteria bacterium]|nr:hypothetical protein [Gammaproteobacteria bacterium]